MIHATKKTKIVATVGPASNNKETLRQLLMAGVNVFRLNFSHGSYEDHQKVIDILKDLRAEGPYHFGILQDLQGPKIRVQVVENNGVPIVSGDRLTITSHEVLGNASLVSTSYQYLAKDVKPGDRILVDDGNLELKVLETTDTDVVTEVVHGGILKSKKGINLPNTAVSAPSLTEKDHEDLLFGLKNQVDWVALSFVRSAQDIISLREIILANYKHARIVAKVEKPEAITNLEEIIDASDAIMVARGDLGVEIPGELVPLIQKRMVNLCNKAGKPVIVATQMLESMIKNARPTRAETSDVANAVLDGADAVMLSAESAAGDFPVLAVETMAKIIHSIETSDNSIYNRNHDILSTPDGSYFLSDNLISAACQMAHGTEVKAICSITATGYSAFQIAKFRPKADIFIFTRHQHLLNRLSLVWGVRCFHFERKHDAEKTFDEVDQMLVDRKFVKSGDAIVNIASLPNDQNLHANTVKVSRIK
jgi:pyruvate kinase